MSLAVLFHSLCAQHVSDINISIIRSLQLCCWITTLVVLFSVRCVLEIWCSWFWVCSFCRLKPAFIIFFKPSNWNVRQAFGNLNISMISYTDCWCLVPFSSNISCKRSHKVHLCLDYRIKTESNICHHITAAGYTARKFSYKACCRCCLDVPVTATLGRVNEASFLELLNCVALLTANVSWEGSDIPLLH